MATKNVKYPGKLGKPITARDIQAEVREASAATPSGDAEAVTAAVHERLRRREIYLLFDLMDHFEIARDDLNRWYFLAHKLASSHVPAFRYGSRVGRPPKSEYESRGHTLAALLMKGSKRKPGPKRKFTDAICRGLLSEVREISLRNGFKGRGAVTKALTEMLTIDARERGKSVSTAILEKLDYFQKRYSDAKKRFPELA